MSFLTVGGTFFVIDGDPNGQNFKPLLGMAGESEQDVN